MNRVSVACAGVAAGLLLTLAPVPARAQTPPDGSAPAAPAAPAQDSKPDPASFFKGTEVGALVDTYYDWFSTRTDALYRNFDSSHNQFTLSMAEVWVSKAPTADSRAGYRLKFIGGPAAATVNSLEPNSSSVLEHIEEGYVSYLAPTGKGLQVDFGKFVTPIGAEVIEAKDDWNYSRSLLFALAIPYYHVGLRATYAPNDKVTVIGLLVNGWNNASENNGAKTFGAQVQFKPNAKLTVLQNYMAGPEQPGDDADWRQLADTVATYTATPKISLMGNYDYGTDTVAGERVHWQGFAGYLKAQANPWFAVTPRFEIYDDASGFTTGTAQTLKDATVTLELKPSDSFLWRIEYRTDFSDTDVFTASDGSLKKTQTSIGFSLLYSFSYKG